MTQRLKGTRDHNPLLKEELKKQGIFVRYETFVDMERGLEEKFKWAGILLLLEVGEECGRRSYSRFALTGKPDLDILRELSRWKSEENWGELSFEKMKLKNATGRIKIKNSFETKGRKSRTPVCYFFRGFLTGFLSELFKRKIKVTERKCEACGEKCCVFEFKPGR